MSCACGWDKPLCSGGRAATVGILAVLRMGVREAGTKIKICNTRYSIISFSSSFCTASSFLGHAVGEASSADQAEYILQPMLAWLPRAMQSYNLKLHQQNTHIPHSQETQY